MEGMEKKRFDPLELKVRESVDQRRARLRDEFPAAAAVVDEFRAAFGPGIRVLRIVENGRAMQSKWWRPSDPAREMTVSQWLSISEKQAKERELRAEMERRRDGR